MPEVTTKKTFYNKVRKQGGSYVVSIPKPIAEHLDLVEGDELGFQKEQSDKISDMEGRENGKYASKWNETLQSGERQ